MAVMTIVIAVIVLLSAMSCRQQPSISTAQFVHLPTAGWTASVPLSFSPHYGDSTVAYDLKLAVRHNNGYRYSNLSLVVDIFADDSSRDRKTIDLTLADEYGNWTSGGFGALYQATVPLVTGVSPDKASKVVVWQAMAGCDTLSGLVDMGIIVSPNE